MNTQECMDVRRLINYFDQHRISGELRSTELVLRGRRIGDSELDHLQRKKRGLEEQLNRII
jgi:hypothetical protein